MKTKNSINFLIGLVTIAIILAMCGCKEYKYDKFNITDKPFVNYTSVELFLGEGAGSRSSIQLISSPADVKYTWNSVDESVATVTQTGLITAVGEGITTITVASQNDETKVSVMVRKWIPLEDFILDANEKTIRWSGRASRFKINTLFVPANTTETDQIQWSTSDPEVATVLVNGWVNYYREGEVTITASIAGIEKSAKIKIETYVPPKDYGTELAGKREDGSYIWSQLDAIVLANVTAVEGASSNYTWRGDLAYTAANRAFTIAVDGTYPNSNTGGQYWSPGESTNYQWYIPGYTPVTTSLNPIPMYVTMDLGVKARYTKMHFNCRTRPTPYAPFPVDFEIWGSNDPKPLSDFPNKATSLKYWTSWTVAAGENTWATDGTWTKIADCQILNLSTGTLLQFISATSPINGAGGTGAPEDYGNPEWVRYWKDGYDVDIDNDVDSFRYLRLVVKDTYNRTSSNTAMMMITKIRFWGFYDQ